MEESHMDEFEVTGHYIGVKENGKSNDVIETPYVRMTFGSSDEAKQYYERGREESYVFNGVDGRWVLDKGMLPENQPIDVKAKLISKTAENKIKEAGGAVVLTA
ncbi:hypothetical protein IFM89_027376 [Coptis chinensis]|uniref:Large ribosomal subunit protein uL15/eL18 domain-containing protein n=1 Tax=Coptis chinensis TaxID=261450 RepID=A0A835H9A8_9MAGN|nr:hypothetical protein IFM89_027376 [Coptis chinensis]